jgi:transposase
MHVGWDWASQGHDVTVIDDTGQLVDRWSLAHTEAGIHQAMTRLAGHGRPEHLPVAIQATSGIVVDRLLAAGHPVVPIHPNSFNAARPRWGASKAKSDPGDSFKLAEDLRTDSHRLRRLQPPNAATRHLQAISRLRADHLEAKTTATNQLNACWRPTGQAPRPSLPAWTATSRWTSWSAIPPRRPPSGWARPAWPPSWAATAIAAGAPQGSCFTGCGPPRSRSTSSIPRSWPTPIRIQVRLLRSLLGSIADLDRALAAALGEHPKATVLQPLPGIGQINLAQVLAEVGPILDRASDLPHAAAEVGASPVTKQSGKGAVVQFRWAANTRARNALGIFADNSRHTSPCTGKPAGAASATPRPSAS